MTNSLKWVGIVVTGVLLLGVVVGISTSFTKSATGDAKITGSLNNYPDLDTPIGVFKGVVATSPHNGKKYVSYKGIPFAKPPVGDLRFARPVPVPKTVRGQVINENANQMSCWSVTKTATSKYYGEDCLYINIYTPYDEIKSLGKPPSSKDKPLPVMVWIHGGGFVAGSAYPEPVKLVTRGQAIVVMLNYRLGVFGFLTTLDDNLPTNNGLWDQQLSLKWVYENIQHFNGDAKSITLFGESAGAVSIGLHAISPVAAPYFSKGILQSGAATSQFSRLPKARAFEFAQNVGCGGKQMDTAALVRCLRNVSIVDILVNDKSSSFKIPLANQQMDFIWMPVVDGEFIVDEPLKLLSNHSFLRKVGAYQKDFMIGLLNDEGALIPKNFVRSIPLTDITEVQFFKDLVEALLDQRYDAATLSKTRAKLSPVIREFYSGEECPSKSVDYESVLDMSSDFLFFIPAMEMAMAVSRCSLRSSSQSMCQNVSISDQEDCPRSQQANSKTFFFHFDFCPPSDLCSAPCMKHGDEVQLEFPKTNFTDPVLENLSDLFIDLVVAFARDSNPGQVVSSGWPEFNSMSRRYLRLAPSPDVRRFLYNTRSTFWFERIPQLMP